MAGNRDLIDGVSAALYNAFGVPVYADFQRQNAIFPCFFIERITHGEEQELDRRYWRTNHFDIHYFATRDGVDIDTLELTDIADTMTLVLEYIDVGGALVRGERMEWRETDGVLHFYISYDFHIMRPRERVEEMQTLDAKGRVNDGNEKS
jgi:hypothetical protein|nr:MAG TPA: tail completion protein [Caudoviricetes sp.]